MPTVKRSITQPLIYSTVLSLCVLGTTLALPHAMAEVYRHVDKDGNVSYSDQPAKGAKTVEVKNTNSIPAVEAPVKEITDDTPEEELNYKSLEIVSPANDSAIEHGPGNFTVTVRHQPELHEEHKLQLQMDGKAVAKPSTKTSFALTNIDRGTHSLQVNIVDADGKTVKSSASSIVHVFRPSVLHPGLRR